MQQVSQSTSPETLEQQSRHNYFYLGGVGLIITACIVGAFVIVKWYKNMRLILIPLLVGITSASVLGAVDALFFLSAETEFVTYLETLGIPDKVVILIVGAISSALSLVVSHYVGDMFADMSTIQSVWLDVVGIFVGTLIIAVCYVVYVKVDDGGRAGGRAVPPTPLLPRSAPLLS